MAIILSQSSIDAIFHISKKRTRPIWLFLHFYITPFCLEVCKTSLFILELRFFFNEAAKDVLSGVTKGQRWVVTDQKNTKLGTRKLLEALGLTHRKMDRGRRSALEIFPWAFLTWLQGGCPSPISLSSNQLTSDHSLQAGLTSYTSHAFTLSFLCQEKMWSDLDLEIISLATYVANI